MKALILFSLLYSLSCLATEWTLDRIIESTSLDKTHDPFEIGERLAKEHPEYDHLMQLADTYKTRIEWVHGVSKRVLKLPYNPDRVKVKISDEFDGWFDELTIPNLIIIDKETSIITLIHELRHALQLGTNKVSEGNWYDLLLKKNNQKIHAFHTKVEKSQLPKAEKTRLKHLATRLVETSSEISAHSGDLKLALSFSKTEDVDQFKIFIQEYKNYFFKSYFQLKAHPLSKDQTFIKDLNDGLHVFLKENSLPKEGE